MSARVMLATGIVAAGVALIATGLVLFTGMRWTSDLTLLVGFTSLLAVGLLVASAVAALVRRS